MHAQKTERSIGSLIIIVALIGAVTTLGVVIGEDFIIPTVVVCGALAAYLAKTEVGRALAHRIRHGPEALEPPVVYGELDELRGRVLELEERLDFAERMLATPKDAERVLGRGEN